MEAILEAFKLCKYQGLNPGLVLPPPAHFRSKQDKSQHGPRIRNYHLCPMPFIVGVKCDWARGADNIECSLTSAMCLLFPNLFPVY